jgi:uncharacterized protein involved in exopolysaccharide biosynthesis
MPRGRDCLAGAGDRAASGSGFGSRQAVSEFRASNELFDVDQTANLSTQQLSDLNAELARARAARAEAESRAQLVQSCLPKVDRLKPRRRFWNRS